MVKPMSDDHKPNRPDEQERIERAGHEVIDDCGFPKIRLPKGEFDDVKVGTSRGFGDFEFKDNADNDDDHQAIIATPEIMVHERTASDAFLILACDGIFDVMSNDVVANFVMKKFQDCLGSEGAELALTMTADALLRECLNLESKDNMSVIIVALGSFVKKMPRDLPIGRLEYQSST
jgi:serine/threonine protein phosphatase PrpC